MATVERQMPTWREIAERCNYHVTEGGEWAGAPLPIEGLPLVLEPRYPYQGLSKCFNECESEEGDSKYDGHQFVNAWYSWDRNAHVTVIRKPDGKSIVSRRPNVGGRNLTFWLDTMRVASIAWDVEAELQAIDTLQGLISEHMWRAYVLSGAFIESSKRSGVFYVFRKCRPTVAICGDPLRILAVLCLHPIGYYKGTWAGAMVPTDDVIAHLLMMRGDERKFWSKSNQHPLWAPEAGV